MINPANYYNPFAKYNYISKTRGVYIPRDAQPLLQASTENTVKSTSIYSENYDPETDVLSLLNEKTQDNWQNVIKSIFNKNNEH